MNGLKAKRAAAGLSLRELSRRSGVAVETISRIETGKARPQVRTLNKLADALGVDPVELTTPAATPTTKQEDRRMKQNTITVPAFYADPSNPNLWRRWDNSEDAWMWKGALDFKNDAKIFAAAYFYRYTQDWSTILGLLKASGWTSYFAEDADEEAFIEAHREEIEARARVL